MSAQEWRITDGDRHSAVEALGEHFAVGRLDQAELDDRSERAWAAKTNLDLRPLFADLPEPHGPVTSVAPRPHVPVRRRLPVPVPALLALLFVVLVLTHGFFVLPLLFVGFWLARSWRWRAFR